MTERDRRAIALQQIRRELLDAPVETTHIGRFVVLEHLGAGGFGSVYAAHDPVLDRKVALKLLRTDDRALLREARTLAKLAHPNVVTVHEVVQDDGRVVLVMELVAGARLDRWVREHRPPARAIVEAFVAAGRGLAAAHARGLVHRDVKPPNILMGDDGQVRIADFGLARSAPERGEGSTLALLRTGDDSDSPASSGSVAAGTPRYWAPELRSGAAASPASDQYAFCLSLLEMLAIIDDPVAGRIERVVQRGLRDDPSARWPTMEALLAALSRGPFRPGWLVAGCAVLVAAGAPWAMNGLLRHQEALGCRSEAEVGGPRWDSESARRVREAFEATGLVYAEETWTRVEDRLGTYPGAWRAAYERACRAARVDEQRSEASFARSRVCFEDRTRAFETLVDAFAAVNAEGVRKAVPTVFDLPNVEACDDERWLHQHPVPDDDQLADAVADLRVDLQRAVWARATGELEDATGSLLALRERATALGWDPIVAEVALELGKGLRQQGDYARAGEALELAYSRAGAIGLDMVAADAAIALTGLAGEERARPDQALVWAASASMLLDRLDDQGRRRARLATSVAGAHRRAGDLDAAREHAEQALQMLRAAPDATEVAVADAIAALAVTGVAAGDYAAAARGLMEALEVKTRVLGPNHPSIHGTLINLAGVELTRGELERSLALNEQALAGAGRLGERHPQVLGILSNMAVIHMRMGSLERAQELARQVVDGRNEVLGPQHPDTITALNNLAAVSFESGRFDEAVEVFEELLEGQQALETPAPLEVARTLHNLAAARIKLGQPDAARSSLVDALEILERNFDGEHPEVLRTRAGLGVSYMDAGELVAAAAILDPVLEIRRRILEPHDSELAMTIGNVGLLAHHRGELERARELLEEADELHRTADRRSLDSADVAHNLAETHRLLQDRPRAIAVYERALALRTEVLGPEHEATEVTRTALRMLQDEAPK